MIVVIDNYDSFTYNLVQILWKHRLATMIFQKDHDCLQQLKDRSREIRGFLLSPGPGHPSEATLSRQVVEVFSSTHPILGICLGHQVIAEVFGGKIRRATVPIHGKQSEIYHKEQGSLRNIPSPFRAVRYHSLLVEKETFPSDLDVHAWTSSGEIMGLCHKSYRVEGFQFHPESILSEYGEKMLENFFVR